MPQCGGLLIEKGPEPRDVASCRCVGTEVCVSFRAQSIVLGGFRTLGDGRSSALIPVDLRHLPVLSAFRSISHHVGVSFNAPSILVIGWWGDRMGTLVHRCDERRPRILLRAGGGTVWEPWYALVVSHHELFNDHGYIHAWTGSRYFVFRSPCISHFCDTRGSQGFDSHTPMHSVHTVVILVLSYGHRIGTADSLHSRRSGSCDWISCTLETSPGI